MLKPNPTTVSAIIVVVENEASGQHEHRGKNRTILCELVLYISTTGTSIYLKQRSFSKILTYTCKNLDMLGSRFKITNHYIQY